MRLISRQTHNPASIRRPKQPDFTDLMTALYILVFAQIRHRICPAIIPIFIKRQIGFIIDETAPIMINTHPFINIFAVFLKLDQACHNDNPFIKRTI